MGEPAPIAPESYAPVAAANNATHNERLDEVRERLGLLSRREMIATGAAAALAPSAEAVAHEGGGRGIERGASFKDGIARLRERARTELHEDAYLFTDTGRGTRWTNLNAGTLAWGDRSGSAGLAYVDRRVTGDIVELARDGAEVTLVHTHPTRMLKESVGNLPEEAELDRVPPSSIDILNMFGMEQGLPAGARDRLSFIAVAEAGTWSYSPGAGSSIERSLEAARPHLAELEGPLRRNARAAARDYEDALGDMVRSAPDGRKMLNDFTRSIESGTYAENLRYAPTDLLQQGTFLDVLPMEDFSPEGRRYFEAVVRARTALNEASRANDPDGYSFDELLQAAPQLRDESTNFEPYRAFWAYRGVTLEFDPAR
jgi:hypothetical protein